MVDSGGKVPVVQERGVAQSGTVLLQRHDQPGRRRARRADSERPAPDRLQLVLRFVRTGKPGAAETGPFGFRPVEQGGRLLSGVQHVGRAHTASDGEKRIGRSKGSPTRRTVYISCFICTTKSRRAIWDEQTDPSLPFPPPTTAGRVFEILSAIGALKLFEFH